MNGPWSNEQNPQDRVLVGVIGPENPKRPGTYRFQGFGSGKNECYTVEDAILLTSDGSLDGSGSHAKPIEGSQCVALKGPGGSIWITGFHLPPKFDDQSDTPPSIGDASDSFGKINNVAGDKVYRSVGNATLILKRGGSVVVQGDAGVATMWLKETNTFSTSAANINESADGYKHVRGRIKVGKSDPETISVEDFYHQVGPSATRIRIRHGNLDSNGRRELTIAKVSSSGGQVTGTMTTRETYFDDGSWIGEGPKYQFGGSGADEPAVLGNVFVSFIDQFIEIIKSLTVNTAWGPSNPPLPSTILALDQLKQQFIDNGKILSDFILFSKGPATLGTVNG